MFGKNKTPRDETRAGAVKATVLAAYLLAGLLTFITGPYVYRATVGWVQDFTAYHYGPFWVDPVAVAWAILVGLLILLLTRASLVTSMSLAALTLAARFI